MTRTNTHSIVGLDVRSIVSSIDIEWTTLAKHSPHAFESLEIDATMVDVSLLFLNAVVDVVVLQFHMDGVLVREYRYTVLDAPCDAWGPPADHPPLGRIPEGCETRVVAHSNPDNVEQAEAWFRRLGWTPAAPLTVPSAATEVTYGAFTSGGYSLERTLISCDEVEPVQPRRIYGRK